MLKNITPKEVDRLINQIDNGSPFDEDDKSVLKGLIAGQSFFYGLMVDLVLSLGYQRTKIIREIAKILAIDPKKKKNKWHENDNPSGAAPIKDKDLPKAKPLNNNREYSEGEEGSQGGQDLEDGEDPKGEDGSQNGKGPEDKKKTHPKRANDEYAPVASHVYHHENLEPSDQCPKCLKGRVYSFREKIIPILIGRSPLAYEEHRLQTLRCNACGALFEPQPEELPRVGNSMPSAQAVLTLLHYQIGVPFASVSKLQEKFGQKVSPAQLWSIIEQTAKSVQPIYHELEKQAANSRLFYTDDTTARILAYYSLNKENRNKKQKHKAPSDRVGTYTSLIIGCTPDFHEIYLFYHGRKYAGENLGDLLVDRDKDLEIPIQMKDASTMNVPKKTKVRESKCNAHGIRKFKDIAEIYPKWCGEVLSRYKKVSRIDQMLLKKRVSDSERLTYHKKHSLPLMNGIKEYVTGLINDKAVEPNSSLGQAIAYFCTHFTELSAFCCIEGAPFDNNLAERALKIPIRLRKVSMFYKTEHGGEVAGILQSVLYTAQEAGINPLTYLQTILENSEEVRKNPSAFLPWSFQDGMAGVMADCSLAL